MPIIRLAAEDDFTGWRDAARALAIAGVPPGEVHWQVGDGAADLFAAGAPPPAPERAGFSVPRAFVELAETVVLHADAERFALLYLFLTALRDRERHMDDTADPLRRRLDEMAKAVRRDIHKMRAFVRFREVSAKDNGDGDTRYVAWFEPEHHIVRANAGFFVRRFATMRWSILTPELSVHWDGEVLTESVGAHKGDAPDGDPIEEVWKAYYASTFNPARLKVGAMLKEMPKKYWKNMPETALVPGLVASAQARESRMIETAAATTPTGNADAALAALREEAASCRRCPLWQPATQTVFGEGPADAALMFVGEQPGDEEDLAGRPFVGPAGRLWNRALDEAGIDRTRAYVTNAVKHFKYEPRGKRRIHSKPNGYEIDSCRWWIDQERAIVRPAVTVALGASAAHSLLGRTVTISRTRGSALALPDGGELWVTVHPSFLLRIPEEDRKAAEYAQFVRDLRQVKARAEELGSV